MIRKIEQGILVCYSLQSVFPSCKSDCGELVCLGLRNPYKLVGFFLHKHENGERIRSRRR